MACPVVDWANDRAAEANVPPVSTRSSSETHNNTLVTHSSEKCFEEDRPQRDSSPWCPSTWSAEKIQRPEEEEEHIDTRGGGSHRWEALCEFTSLCVCVVSKLQCYFVVTCGCPAAWLPSLRGRSGDTARQVCVSLTWIDLSVAQAEATHRHASRSPASSPSSPSSPSSSSPSSPSEQPSVLVSINETEKD
uniref:Uncharacterized protein n=1 Tax=Knipowitschia caucasica TaxID=637954 RepID=A0AAV2MEN4_KNICA